MTSGGGLHFLVLSTSCLFGVILPRQIGNNLCELNFISQEDELAAHSEFINASDINDNVISDYPIRPRRYHLRSRRQATNSKLYTIETAIFVDYHLKQRFQNRLSDLKRLVMAIMNEVQLIYNYQTMKIPIRIVVTKFEVLDKSDSGPNNAAGDIDRYLDNFCSWQSKRVRSASPETRWDHALMLTGLDLFKESNGKRNKKVLGLAWVNGMCKPTYSCTLNEGKSFEAAFVIAHEMAHSLGILHDGKGNNCDPDRYLMSEKTGPGKVNWSPCSNKYLENFLNRDNGKCLENDAAPLPELDFKATNRLPGEQYGPDLQCQLALGTQYKAYFSNKEPFNDVCRELWCLSGSWATPAHPALEGSTCGPSGEKCYQGSCSLTRGLRAVTRKPLLDTPFGNTRRQRQYGRPNSRLRLSVGMIPQPLVPPIRKREAQVMIGSDSSGTIFEGIRNIWDKLVTGVSGFVSQLVN